MEVGSRGVARVAGQAQQVSLLHAVVQLDGHHRQVGIGYIEPHGGPYDDMVTILAFVPLLGHGANTDVGHFAIRHGNNGRSYAAGPVNAIVTAPEVACDRIDVFPEGQL